MSYQDPYYVKPAAEFDQYGNPVAKHAVGGDQYQPSKHADDHIGHGHGGVTSAQFDQYGNPVAKHAAGGDQYQPSKHADDHIGHGHGGVTSALHRSGSSSSSSSEDDGEGGRRKKGMKDKIKEKLPGQGHKDDQHQQTHANMTATPIGEEKKPGMMDKIKEKLPGGNKHQTNY